MLFLAGSLRTLPAAARSSGLRCLYSFCTSTGTQESASDSHSRPSSFTHTISHVVDNLSGMAGLPGKGPEHVAGLPLQLRQHRTPRLRPSHSASAAGATNTTPSTRMPAKPAWK